MLRRTIWIDLSKLRGIGSAFDLPRLPCRRSGQSRHPSRRVLQQALRADRGEKRLIEARGLWKLSALEEDDPPSV